MYGSLQDPGVVAPQVAAKMRQLPGFVDVNTDMQINAPQPHPAGTGFDFMAPPTLFC